MRWNRGPTPASSFPQKLFATGRVVTSELVGEVLGTSSGEEGDAQEREATEEGSDGVPGMAQ